MLITADQLLAHAIGDYVLQSEWMATEKTKRSIAALCHVVTYAIPFFFLKPSFAAMFVIVSTHFVIDRWRLARYVVWLKNWIAPPWLNQIRHITLCDHPEMTSGPNFPWGDCIKTGYPPTTPDFLAVWLLIITDNIMHIVINGLALKYL